MAEAKKIRCPHCDHKISTTETVRIVGNASVYGETSVDKFRSEGIVWSVSDSDCEQIVCPKCNEPFDMPPSEE